MRLNNCLALRHLTLLVCLLVCCALVANDSAPAYARSSTIDGAYLRGVQEDSPARAGRAVGTDRHVGLFDSNQSRMDGQLFKRDGL